MSACILAIDTATEACSVALCSEDKIYHHFAVCPREHTQRILPMIEQVLNEANLSLTDLDAIAYGQGPGSFTGIRVAMGIVQGLALGAQLPVIGISTLKMMAQGAYRLQKATQVLTAIDARMSEVYWAAYERQADQWQIRQNEVVITPATALMQMNALAGEWVTAGSAWPSYPELSTPSSLTLVNSDILLPNALDMLELALIEWQQGRTMSIEQAQPHYLRNEVAWKKLPQYQ